MASSKRTLRSKKPAPKPRGNGATNGFKMPGPKPGEAPFKFTGTLSQMEACLKHVQADRDQEVLANARRSYREQDARLMQVLRPNCGGSLGDRIAKIVCGSWDDGTYLREGGLMQAKHEMTVAVGALQRLWSPGMDIKATELLPIISTLEGIKARLEIMFAVGATIEKAFSEGRAS